MSVSLQDGLMDDSLLHVSAGDIDGDSISVSLCEGRQACKTLNLNLSLLKPDGLEVFDHLPPENRFDPDQQGLRFQQLLEDASVMDELKRDGGMSKAHPVKVKEGVSEFRANRS